MPRITVGVRVRPDANSKDSRLEGFAWNADSGLIELNVAQTQYSFNVDNVFHDKSSQQDIFNGSTSSILDGVLEGYNGCVFAYGQTGAGVAGGEDGYGICAQTAVQLFSRARSFTDTFAFRLSILEIYNENLIDLLVASPPSNPGPNAPPPPPKLNVIDTEQGVFVPGMHILPIDSADEAINFFVEAQSNRAVAEHQLNRRSSRSHVIYTYFVTRTHMNKNSQGGEDPVVHQSKLHIVDLAGSERVNKTQSTGNVQKEANYINKSLSYLEQVVIALAQTNRDHIPFRQSKLTYLLKDCLGGNCNTYLIACIWPKRDHSWETLSTLRFAARMKTIETHPVRNRLVAKEQAPSRVMQQQVDALKRELALRDFIAGKDNCWSTGLSKAQKLLTCKQTMEFAQRSPNLNTNASASSNSAISGENGFGPQDVNEEARAVNMIPLNSLSQAYMMLDAMRQALWIACESREDAVKLCMQQAFVAEGLLSGSKVQQRLPGAVSSSSAAAAVPTPTPSRKISSSIDGGDAFGGDSNGNTDDAQSVDSFQGSNIVYSESIATKSKEEYLQEFSAGEGKALHDSFEEAKEQLKTYKQRQREIVSLLNEQKAIIDDVTAQLTSMSEDELQSSDAELLQSHLETAKKNYRTGHHELQICKEQITETQSLKKRAMASLLASFSEFMLSLGIEL